MERRVFLKVLLALASSAVVPIKALAAIWNTSAFEASKLDVALRSLGIHQLTESHRIKINAPDKAENGAVVQIEVQSELENSESMAILVENNPTPLIANFVFNEGANAFVVTRIKMAETSYVQVVVKVGNQYFSAKKRVEVLENGCG